MSSDPQAVPERVQLPESEARKLTHSLAEQYRIELVEQMQAKKRIEALEGEVARLEKAHDERLKQNTLERAATHKQFHRAEAADARAERLRAVIERLDVLINKDNEEAKTLIRETLGGSL